ncbi:complement C1q-like protein 4 [Clupea harengus]|uniref:Complement C1q-like protein 4 n=1 Tax=Clupea harengus TaxID=7950 RepID=A0A6P8FQB4_CLUHA|nr:complement C1q-like protein 4 [Clupea harengus]
MVVELRVTLSLSQDELRNTKDLLRSVTERLAATENDMEDVKKDTAAQHTDLTIMKTEVMNLKMELSASETEVEELKTGHAAQEAELTAVETRLIATETKVENLEKRITENPKVAFSAGLTNSGYIETGKTDLNLVFTKIITNVGKAYNYMNGYFTAPVKGVYYFRFTVMDVLAGFMEIRMLKNGQHVMHLKEYDAYGQYSYLSSGVTLQLELGDVVNMRLPPGHKLYDDSNNHSIFSGFLLFSL